MNSLLNSHLGQSIINTIIMTVSLSIKACNYPYGYIVMQKFRYQCSDVNIVKGDN